MPAVGNFVVNVGDRWKNFRGGIENVSGIGVEAMTEFTVGAEGFFAGCGKGKA